MQTGQGPIMEPDVRGDFTPQGDVLFTTRWKQLSCPHSPFGLVYVKNSTSSCSGWVFDHAKNQFRYTWHLIFLCYYEAPLKACLIKWYLSYFDSLKMGLSILSLMNGSKQSIPLKCILAVPLSVYVSSNIAWQYSSTLIKTKLAYQPFRGWWI